VKVYTARMVYARADRLDVTRKSAGVEGLVFAPSWAILRPMLALRRDSHVSKADWRAYVDAYTQEMRDSFRGQRARWDAVLSRDEVTLVCYCKDPARCHRTVLAKLFGKLGAIVGGERVPRAGGDAHPHRA